jgi:hypothetical protein
VDLVRAIQIFFSLGWLSFLPTEKTKTHIPGIVYFGVQFRDVVINVSFIQLNHVNKDGLHVHGILKSSIGRERFSQKNSIL